MRVRPSLILATLLGLASPAVADYNSTTGQFTPGSAALSADNLNNALARKCGSDASSCSVTVGATTNSLFGWINALLGRAGSSVLDTCASASLTGTTDNTVCIQAAVTAACAAQSGNVTMPAGKYAINASVGISAPCAVMLTGSDVGDQTSTAPSTLINVIGTGSAPIYACTGPIATGDRYVVGACGLRNLSIHFANPGNAAATQTGPAVAWRNCKGCVVESVRFWAPYIAVSNFAGDQNRISNSIIDQVVSPGVAVLNYGSDTGCSGNLGNCAGRGDLFQIDHTIISAASAPSGSDTGSCIQIQDFAETTWIDHVACNQTNIGINISCPNSASLSACPQFVGAVRFESEPNGVNNSSHGAGIVASDFVSLDCTDCQLYGYTVDNLVKLLNGRFTGSSDAQFHGGRFTSAQAQCFLSSIGSLSVTGAIIHSCGKGGSNAVGIELRGNGNVAVSGGNRVMGNVIGWDYIGGTALTSITGVLLGSGQDYNVVTSNTFRGATAGVTDNSGGTHNVLTPNSGP